MEQLKEIAKQLVSDGKGILAADESIGTIGKRFALLHIDSTEENRIAYREMLFTTPDIEKYISGVILFDETIHQSTQGGQSFVSVLTEKGIIPGIKVDEGKVALPNSPNEYITEGLDGLEDRLKKYYELGARFAKWRAVITIGEGLPTDEDIRIDAERLAKYAKICQEHNIVPIVEPEVLMEGIHTQERCYEVTELVLTHVFDQLVRKDVELDSMLLKPNMIVSGNKSGEQISSIQVAQKTLDCFMKHVPAEVPGIVFLSGGQSEEEARNNLQEMHKLEKKYAWELSFSFGRALQTSALKVWGGKKENILEAQQVFFGVAKKLCDSVFHNEE
jgi:fructose-bisphosphate aldolase, class I